MKYLIFKKMMKIIIPKNITFLWNFGSLLGMCLTIQIISGFFLAFRYSLDSKLAFLSISKILNNNWNGVTFRNMHANGASFFFICLFTHIARGLYFKSFNYYFTWSIGVLIFLITMGTAFLGYVLPWGQMSFWGASVITNLVSSIPYLGNILVIWIWSGHSINNATLIRFFCLHFILPFIIFLMMMIHLMFLHLTGSNNPLNLNRNFSKIYFNPIFTIKDTYYFLLFFLIYLFITLYNPFIFFDSDNFLISNPMVTPEHIQPEWYFLFAYAILRSIPNKLGGVIALLFSIIILLFLSMINYKTILPNIFFSIFKNLMMMIFINVLLLTWIGMQIVEFPFLEIGMLSSLMYFFLYFIISLTNLFIIKFI